MTQMQILCLKIKKHQHRFYQQYTLMSQKVGRKKI
jgi:hypothetical protein